MREYEDMDDIEVTKEFTVGVASMDQEHAGQLSLLNDLKAAVRNGADDKLVYALLDELVEHTNLHFLSEQLAMKLNAYQAYEAHFLEHERLMVEVRHLKRVLKKTGDFLRTPEACPRDGNGHGQA